MMDLRKMDGTKLPWHMLKVHKVMDLQERIMPIYIDAGIAKKCCAKCVYCYGKNQNLSGEMIDPNILVARCAEAPAIGIKGIGFVGDGEPTMNPGMYDALDAGNGNGLDMAISTNGILVNTEDKVRKILRNCVWMRFNLSAVGGERYKAIHGVDCWRTVESNILMMADYKHKYGYNCDVGLQAVFVPGMMNEDVVKLAEFAVSSGVDYLVVKQCSLPDGNKAVGEISFDPAEYDNPKTIQALKDAESLSCDRTKIVVKWKIIGQKGRRPYDGCPSIAFLPQMSGNGDIFPCGQMFGGREQYAKYKIGNVHDNTFKEIFTSQRYYDVLDEMANKFDVHHDCHGACRQDKLNEWLWNYSNIGDWGKAQLMELGTSFYHKPMGVNFL